MGLIQAEMILTLFIPHLVSTSCLQCASLSGNNSGTLECLLWERHRHTRAVLSPFRPPVTSSGTDRLGRVWVPLPSATSTAQFPAQPPSVLVLNLWLFPLLKARSSLYSRCWDWRAGDSLCLLSQFVGAIPPAVLINCWGQSAQTVSSVFGFTCGKTAKMWDLNINQAIRLAQGDAPVKTIPFD